MKNLNVSVFPSSSFLVCIFETGDFLSISLEGVLFCLIYPYLELGPFGGRLSFLWGGL